MDASSSLPTRASVHTGATNNSPKSIIAACARAGACALRAARAGIDLDPRRPLND
jgi:hypothetical protein